MTVSHMSDAVQSPAFWRLASFIRRQQHQWQERETAPGF